MGIDEGAIEGHGEIPETTECDHEIPVLAM